MMSSKFQRGEWKENRSSDVQARFISPTVSWNRSSASSSGTQKC